MSHLKPKRIGPPLIVKDTAAQRILSGVVTLISAARMLVSHAAADRWRRSAAALRYWPGGG